MINLISVEIAAVEDYNKILQHVREGYIHIRIINELKDRIGTKVTRLLIEYPYYDSDYLSTYYLFYSKKHNPYEKKCYRLHFLKDNTYLGYITLRPTVDGTQVGRSYVHPSLTLDQTAHMLCSKFVSNILYTLDDIYFAYVPLYDRMQFGYRSVKYQFEQLSKSKSYDFPNDRVTRTYLTSANSLKRETRLNKSMHPELRNCILSLELPKFIWCVDVARPSEFERGKTSCRVIIDSTCSSYDKTPWVLIHDKNSIVYREGEKWYNTKVSIEGYDMYINNLRRFEPCQN